MQNAESPRTKDIEATNVLDIYGLLETNGVDVWIDGGWGIDALLGAQTRSHADLDIAVAIADVPRLRALLEDRGYREQDRPDSSPYNFVLRDDDGRLLDVHACRFDAEGRNIEGIAYPKRSLTGVGTINGHTVRCIPLDWVVNFHANYEPDAEDIQDMEHLRQRFGIEPPPNYR